MSYSPSSAAALLVAAALLAAAAADAQPLSAEQRGFDAVDRAIAGSKKPSAATR